ncbi:MAG TPA: hydrolase [Micromonosporaceae bacterium]|nr:hydrolase [Micromonosporaceae bacterium]HCU51099.1 hydrolase [Micromonosporaceae bacterium]
MTATDREIQLPAAGVNLDATLSVPDFARGIIVFAHGSGSSRHSPRNRLVAARLNGAGFDTLLLDLLTAQEERVDARTAQWRFDIGLLSERLVAACDWVGSDPGTSSLPAGLFGASTGAAAALVAAAARPEQIRAVVSRGGRPDLAGQALTKVQASTLLIVGGEDYPVIQLNQQAAATLGPLAKLVIVPGASHLFTEPGALEQVAELAVVWFDEHLGGIR